MEEGPALAGVVDAVHRAVEGADADMHDAGSQPRAIVGGHGDIRSKRTEIRGHERQRVFSL